MTNPKFNLIKTDDGTYTLFLNEYNESMHSMSGAYEEALLKHVYPSGILDKEKECLSVLDVGFGLGYNILALIVELNKRKFAGSLKIISFEKDSSLFSVMDMVRFNDMRDQIYSIIKSAFINKQFNSGKRYIAIMFGDARDSVKQLADIKFDAVFFDPFSPSKNPELWSVDFFKEIYSVMDDTGALTTYSSAPQIRIAMIEAEFTLGKGPSVGKKKEGTIAAKRDIIRALTANEILLLKEDSRSIPYRDLSLSNTREDILQKRIEEIRRVKNKESIVR